VRWLLKSTSGREREMERAIVSFFPDITCRVVQSRSQTSSRQGREYLINLTGFYYCFVREQIAVWFLIGLISE
jgi:hypothetical protein